jgi:hypothetical protein
MTLGFEAASREVVKAASAVRKRKRNMAAGNAEGRVDLAI